MQRVALGFVNLVLFVFSGPIMLAIELAGWALSRRRADPMQAADAVDDELLRASELCDDLADGVERVNDLLARGLVRDARHECERLLERVV